MFNLFKRKKKSQSAAPKYSNPTQQLSRTSNEDFGTSMAVGMVTDNALLGMIAGGSIVGSIVGGIIGAEMSSFDNSDNTYDSDLSCDSSSSSYDSSSSCDSSSSDW